MMVSPDVSFMEDANTFPRASKAAQAGIQWLLDNAAGWAPTGKFGQKPDTPLHIGRLFQGTRSWLSLPPKDQAQIYRKRLTALELVIKEVKLSQSYVRANGDLPSLPGGIRLPPRGKTAAEWNSQCGIAIETLETLGEQTRLLLQSETRTSQMDRATLERNLYKVLFEIFANLSGKESAQVPLSATQGPRTFPMNFMLSVVSELEDELPSLRTIRRYVKG